MTTELQADAVELQQSESKRAETTPDELEKALLSLELGTAWSSAAELDEDVKTIRAHIAAQSSEIEALKDWWYKNKVPQGWSFAVYDTSKYKLIAKDALAQGAKK